MDSYLLHADRVGWFDANSVDPSPRNRYYEGSIRFAQPIVGVITSKDALKKTDVSLGVPGLYYAVHDTKRIGLERVVPGAAASGEPGDVFTISNDRRTLHVRIHLGRNGDNLRVLARSAPAESEERTK